MPIARGQITIVDLSDGKTINVYLTTTQPLSQIYSEDNKVYIPNWEIDNFKITPEIYVAGTSVNQASKLINATWSINNSTDISKWGSYDKTAPFALTLNKNMTDDNQLVIEFTGTYVDINKSQIVLKSNITITRVENPGSILSAIIHTPEGNIFKNNDVTSLPAVCYVYRGSTLLVNSTYQWYKFNWSLSKQKNSESWTELSDTNGYTGTTTNTLTVPADDVLNFETYKCIATPIDITKYSSNTSVSNTVAFADLSDPYFIEIFAPNGNIIKNNTGSVNLVTEIWQNGIKVNDGSNEDKFTYNWKQYDENGNVIQFDASSYITIGKPNNKKYLTIPANIISNKSTFICEVDENKVYL